MQQLKIEYSYLGTEVITVIIAQSIYLFICVMYLYAVFQSTCC